MTTKAAKGLQRATVRGTGVKAVKQRAGKQGTLTRQARKPGPVAKRAAAAAPPKVSKDALRAQVTKLERTNANLRTKNKALTQAVGEAADRIAQLEGEISRQKKHAAKEAAPVRTGKTPGRHAAGTQERSDRDPGDAVPPGIAVQDPEPLGEQDRRSS
jgi:predicted RNase H-like nuclease (RuvC/YqgF family)